MAAMTKSMLVRLLDAMPDDFEIVVEGYDCDVQIAGVEIVLDDGVIVLKTYEDLNIPDDESDEDIDSPSDDDLDDSSELSTNATGPVCGLESRREYERPSSSTTGTARAI